LVELTFVLDDPDELKKAIKQYKDFFGQAYENFFGQAEEKGYYIIHKKERPKIERFSKDTIRINLNTETVISSLFLSKDDLKDLLNFIIGEL